MSNKKGDMGIGTLILFIAFILVAAVAAGVLISTTAALQSKALSTGKATTTEVGTSLSAVQIYAEDATDNNNDKQVDYFYYTVKLGSGSEPVRFQDLLLTFNTDNQSQEYAYLSTVNCTATAVAGDGTTIFNTTNADKFGITYSLQSANSITGYMVPGDVVKTCFKSPRAIVESDDIKITYIPKVGSALVVKTTTPGLMIDKRLYIFP